MSCAMTQESCNRSNCKRYGNFQEPPVRDSPLSSNAPSSFPEPPNGQSGDWDLQYCQWSGWTWVRKTDKEKSVKTSKPNVQASSTSKHERARSSKSSEQLKLPEGKKRNRGCFNYFKKKKTLSPDKAVAFKGAAESPQSKKSEVVLKESLSDDYCCFCCCDHDPCFCGSGQPCCPCFQNQVCCSCIQYPKCCCTSGEPKKDCRCIETQTVKEVKEQATKMSEMHMPKPAKVCSCGRRRRCRCRRPMCCHCVRNTCCPCVQQMCCCKNDQSGNKMTSIEEQCSQDNGFQMSSNRQKGKGKPNKHIENEPLINYCLNGNLRKPTTIDFLNFKSNNFSTLHKSLDILLRNNINIMSLFDDKRESRYESNPVSSYSSNHTITCLSNDNLKKKSDPEHCKLLTAVCDAILSNHKFDNDKVDPSVPKSVHKSCDRKDSQNSFNIFSSRGFLQKILSELNFPTLTKSDDDVNIHREMGVQVGCNTSYKTETCQAKRSLTRLVRNKSRVLTAPRFPKKVENLRRSIDLLKVEGYDVKALKRGLLEIKSKGNRANTDENKTSCFKIGNDDPGNKVRTSFHSTINQPSGNTAQEASSRLQDIEHLLSTIEYINSSSGSCCKEQGSTTCNEFDSLLQNSQNVDLLEATSPPFTDTDLLFNADDRKSPQGESGGKISYNA